MWGQTVSVVDIFTTQDSQARGQVTHMHVERVRHDAGIRIPSMDTVHMLRMELGYKSGLRSFPHPDGERPTGIALLRLSNSALQRRSNTSCAKDLSLGINCRQCMTGQVLHVWPGGTPIVLDGRPCMGEGGRPGRKRR